MDNTAEEIVLVTGSQVNDDNKEQTVVRNLIASNQSGSSNLTSEQLVLLLLLQHQSLDPLRRNLDDFFLVLLAVITYGNKYIKETFVSEFEITIRDFSSSSLLCRCYYRSTNGIPLCRSGISAEEKRDLYLVQEHTRWM